MSSSKRGLHRALLAGGLVLTAGPALSAPVGLGMPLSEAEIAAVDLTVFPDGENLPEGQGSVDEGRLLYAERCAVCHGKSGSEGPSIRLSGSLGLFSLSDPLRILRIMQVNGLLVLSTGQQWPYATSLFDFIRRAMPQVAPKTLTNDQVYALTAWILYLNDIVDADAVMSRDTLPRVVMPARERFTFAEEPGAAP